MLQAEMSYRRRTVVDFYGQPEGGTTPCSVRQRGGMSGVVAEPTRFRRRCGNRRPLMTFEAI